MATTSATSSTATGGSQIDVNSLASQLVAVERAPLDAQIARATTAATTQISALGTLKGALSTFQTALSGLKTVSSFLPLSASSSDANTFTATATSAAAPGTYGVEVSQLAQAQQLASKPFATGSTQVVGTGTLSISVGSNSFTVNIDSSNNTVAGIRDAINNATGNTGVEATLIQANDGARLVLSSSTTGAANTIQVAASGGDGGLSVLNYNSSLTTNYTQLAAAQDAIVKIGGFTAQSSTNTISNAIDGVTLNLVAAKPGTTLSLTVAKNSTATLGQINTFVTAYNALQTSLAPLGSYDATTQTAGPMLGDALLNGIQSQLRRVVGAQITSVSGDLQSLSSIGITTQSDGTLAVNSTKLQNAINSNSSAVASIFGSANGVVAQINTQLNAGLSSDGAIAERTTTLVNKQRDLTTQQDQVDARMTALQTQYVTQFTALDTLLSTLQTTSSYLTQQFAAIANINDPSNS